MNKPEKQLNLHQPRLEFLKVDFCQNQMLLLGNTKEREKKFFKINVA